MSGPSVVVVGDAGLDVLAAHRDLVPHGGDARARIHFTGGGAGATTASWLSAVGARPTLVTRVGADAAGEAVLRELTAAGVECAFTTDPAASTCSVVVLVDAAGQRSMLADRGAAARLSPSDIDAIDLSAADHLHLSGYVLLDPASRAAGLTALRAARAAGLSTSVDPQAAVLITDPGRFLDDVRGVDLLLPNTPELAALTGSTDPASAKDLLDSVGGVVVTAGADGAHWVRPGGIDTARPDPVRCVDSTGAGDAFNAGLLHAHLTGESIVDSLRAGIRAGTLAVRRSGARPAGTVHCGPTR